MNTLTKPLTAHDRAVLRLNNRGYRFDSYSGVWYDKQNGNTLHYPENGYEFEARTIDEAELGADQHDKAIAKMMEESNE